MARLYSNENFPLPAVEELRRLGHDCATVAQTADTNIPLTDPQVLAAATADAHAVVTFNRRHFISLHRQQPNHAGIIVCTVNPDFIALAERIHEAIAPLNNNLQGQLIRITRPG